MFEPELQFIPSPEAVVMQVWEQVVEVLGRCPREMFDPSAGKGDLLNCPKILKRHRDPIGYAVEIDPHLRTILKEDYTVLGADFLTFSDPVTFECVVINPPFNKGVIHVFKAWDFVAPDGVIVGILNAETLKNPYTKERKRLLDLIEEQGGWKSLGSAFKDAERPTDVEVVLFWIHRPARVADPKEFKFSGDFQEVDPDIFQEFERNPLAASDAIDALVGQYRTCVQLVKTRSQVQYELNFHLETLVSADDSENNVEKHYDDFKEIQNLKRRAWRTVIKMSRMNDLGTSDFQKKFDEFVKTQIRMEFNRSNVLEALAMFFQNKDKLITDSICDVFDRATQFHPSNRIHFEGWKSNKGSKLNRTIVLYSGISVSWGAWKVPWNGRASTFFNDLDEVLCRLAGVKQTKGASFYHSIDGKSLVDLLPGKWHRLKFYSVKMHMKGTVHIRFESLYLLDDLNFIVGLQRQWIGGEGF